MACAVTMDVAAGEDVAVFAFQEQVEERFRGLPVKPGDFASRATQPVFGEGPVGAALFILGEQPGDEEDISGRPFVGPAGRLLDPYSGPRLAAGE
ncbi:MAG: hypothetical protein B7Z52_00980 [Burkholderiales bacterium 12-64-5]|nr:MAG: hypothetical protein B7Z52_00980 [Burkholderiales bacterium 12-64-5]